MHHRHDKHNIPMELLRSFVTVAECGSFTEAARTLALSQSAISAQMKRLEQLVGGEIFTKTGLGIQLSQHGEMIAKYAPRILALNDQILNFRGNQLEKRTFRGGFPPLYAEKLLSGLHTHAVTKEYHIQFSCDLTENLLKKLNAGHLDFAILFGQTPMLPKIFAWTEQLVWTRAPHFVLSPGAPIPLVGSPTGFLMDAAIKALEGADLPFTTAFNSLDIIALKGAVASGLGFMALTQDTLPPNLTIARDYFLPPLPEVSVGFYLRDGLETHRLRAIARAFEAIIDPPNANPSTLAAAAAAKVAH